MIRVDWPEGVAEGARAAASEAGLLPSLPDGWRAVASVRTWGASPPAPPTLWIVPPTEMTNALAQLRDQDDVVVEAAPNELIVLRISRLARDGFRLDALTGFFTRAAFRERVKIGLQQASPTRPFSLILVDIDHFKRVNDERGHEAGDRVLSELARRIEGVIPRFAVPSRLAGDEFGIFAAMDEEEATSFGARIVQAARAPIALEGARRATDGPITVTVSVGVATTTHPVDIQAWRAAASDACFAVKARGRNGVAHQSALERHALEEDRDPMMLGFENLTRVVSERVGELIRYRGRRLFASLREEADHDALTGLNGRRYLDRRVPFELDEARESGESLTLALLDIDHFGQVNKSHGWVAGDAVLREVARRVKESTRREDWVARYGGEEIALVLANIEASASRPILERVRRSLSDTPFELPNGEEITVTASIGAADSTELSGGTRALFEVVGDRLLAAKSAGRNRVVVEGP